MSGEKKNISFSFYIFYVGAWAGANHLTLFLGVYYMGSYVP